MKTNYFLFFNLAIHEQMSSIEDNIYNIAILGIIKNSFSYVGEDTMDIVISNILDLSSEYFDSFEVFHKAFRQQDITGNANLDLIIWNALQVDTFLFELFKFMHENKKSFKENSLDNNLFDFLSSSF